VDVNLTRSMAIVDSGSCAWLSPEIPGVNKRRGAYLARLPTQESHVLRWCWNVLSRLSKRRRAKFIFQRDRERFVISHGVLRISSLDTSRSQPANIHSPTMNTANPNFGPPNDRLKLSFNISHRAGSRTLCMASGRAVGIDVEYAREDFDLVEIAEQVFSPQEVSVLKALPTELRTAAFFNCWTRKEAIIKSCRKGTLTAAA